MAHQVIDSLVYELYGLTEDEIRIVERAGHPPCEVSLTLLDNLIILRIGSDFAGFENYQADSLDNPRRAAAWSPPTRPSMWCGSA